MNISQPDFNFCSCVFADKKYMTTNKNDRIKEKRKNMLVQEEKATQEKNKTIRGNKPESTGERRNIKKNRDRFKQNNQNRLFRNNKKMSPASSGRWNENIPTIGRKGRQIILEK